MILTTRKALEQELDYITARQTKQLKSVKCQFPTVNRALMDGFEWGWLVTIAGMSGSGKTTFLNLLETGFIESNDDDIEILSFNLEMVARRLIGRKISHKLGVPLKKIYTSISEKELEYIKNKVAPEIINSKIYYAELTSHIDKIIDAIEFFIKKRQIVEKNKGLIVTLDHSTLVDGQSSDERLVLKDLMKGFNTLKKKYPKSLYLILSQLNRDIESPLRRSTSNLTLHYPIKSDIFGGDSLFQFSDVVMVLHNPYSSLKIRWYGPRKVDAKGKIFLHYLKGRDTGMGVDVFKNELHVNNLIPYKLSQTDFYAATNKTKSGKG